jgi:hypothetical protein
MKSITLAILSALFLSISALADSPAVGFWLVQKSSLTNAVNLAGDLTKVKESDLDEMAECRGHFNGTCDLTLYVHALQFRLKATDQNKTVDYSLRLSWSHVKAHPKESAGKLEVAQAFVAKDGWEKESYVLVMKRLNLKK